MVCSKLNCAKKKQITVTAKKICIVSLHSPESQIIVLISRTTSTQKTCVKSLLRIEENANAIIEIKVSLDIVNI